MDADGQTDKHTRQNLYILAPWAVIIIIQNLKEEAINMLSKFCLQACFKVTSGYARSKETTSN